MSELNVERVPNKVMPGAKDWAITEDGIVLERFDTKEEAEAAIPRWETEPVVIDLRIEVEKVKTMSKDEVVRQVSRLLYDSPKLNATVIDVVELVNDGFGNIIPQHY